MMDDSDVMYIRTSASKSQIFVLISLQPDGLTYDTWKHLKSQLFFLPIDNLVFFVVFWHVNCPYVEKTIHLVLGAN